MWKTGSRLGKHSDPGMAQRWEGTVLEPVERSILCSKAVAKTAFPKRRVTGTRRGCYFWPAAGKSRGACDASGAGRGGSCGAAEQQLQQQGKSRAEQSRAVHLLAGGGRVEERARIRI